MTRLTSGWDSGSLAVVGCSSYIWYHFAANEENLLILNYFLNFETYISEKPFRFCRSFFQTVFAFSVMLSLCFGGLSTKYLWRDFSIGQGVRQGTSHGIGLFMWRRFSHKALLSSLSRSDMFVHTLPAWQKEGEILFTFAFDIHLLFLQSFQGALFAQWNRLCLEEAGQWQVP